MNHPGDLRVFAALSCVSCREGKRRCDRAYPRCGLCTTKQLSCAYPSDRRKKDRTFSTTPSPSGSVTPIQPLSEIIASHTSPFDGPEFPSVFFLSPEVFHHAQLEIPRPHVPISHEITEMVGDPIQIQAVAETYFRTVHGWWPIISKRRFYQVLMSPFAQRRQELYLVTLSMKLSCLSAEDVSPTLYRAVKRFYSDLEVAGLYEIGHAIYPAAFLSTGACARYAVLLGLDRDGRPGSEKSPSFDEREERRRAWWGVLILDRYACAIFSMDPITDDVSRVLNLSDPRRNVITEDPDPDQCLPVDDDMWDKGTAQDKDAIRISDNSTLLMGRFTRFVQAVHLLSRTLQHLRSVPVDVPIYQETDQLRRTILSLLSLSTYEARLRALEFCNQSAVCYSSILLLQQQSFSQLDHADPSDASEDKQLSPEAIVALGEISELAARLLTQTSRSQQNSILEGTSVFTIHMVYQATTTYVQISKRSPDPEIRRRIADLKDILRFYSERWRSANAYMNIIEAQELMMKTLVK